MNPELLPGDIFINDSDRIGPRIVKFLMVSPTIWHWLVGIRDEVRYYHPGMVINSDEVIEQQSTVRIRTAEHCIFSRKHIVYRYKKLTEEQRNNLVVSATADIGKGYDITLIFGKLLTWLTGVKWFVRNIESKEKEICVTRVALWYSRIGITFGKRTWHEVTTDDIDDYCITHPDEWEVISQK
ncbi:MAG: hypothetical protein ACFFAU_01500 [Candidatus Hodarchaeota archaeon]